MHYMCSHATRYHMSVYDATYKTLGHTQPGIYTAAEMGEYSKSKKGMEMGKEFLIYPIKY